MQTAWEMCVWDACAFLCTIDRMTNAIYRARTRCLLTVLSCNTEWQAQQLAANQIIIKKSTNIDLISVDDGMDDD